MDYFEEELAENGQEVVVEDVEASVTESESTDNDGQEIIADSEPTDEEELLATDELIDQVMNNEELIKELVEAQETGLEELKFELKDFIKEELITNKTEKGGDYAMAEEEEVMETEEVKIQQANCDPACDCPVDQVLEDELDTETEIEICCVKVLPENFFTDIEDGPVDDLELATDEENFTLNKLRCCVEVVDAVSDIGCVNRVCVGRAVGCVEYGVLAVPVDDAGNRINRPGSENPVIVCCNNHVCVDNIIARNCTCSCPCNHVEVDITWDDVEFDICEENKAIVTFTGTLTLIPVVGP
ncbi:hypothetical protein JCM16358_01750 [Halanaerocella petrolearia]